MQGNARRNAKKKLEIKITGNMSILILKGLPYSIQQAAWFVQDYELNQIIDYIETYIQDGDKIVDIQIDIDWDFGDIDSTVDTDDDDNNNNNNIDPLLGSLLADLSQSDSDISSASSMPQIEIDEWSDLYDSNGNDSVLEYHSDEEKLDFLPDLNIDFGTDDQNDLKMPPKLDADNVKPLTNDIKYDYKYKIENSDTNWYFNNNDNQANVLYSRTLNLATMFDYCSLMRKVFSVFCTLQWPKDGNNTTPVDIKKAQIWGRSALYKSHLLANYLTNDYAYLTGGVGTYMLEAFWHYNPNGYGFYIVCQQMCEHWGAWMKSDRRACGDQRANKYLWQIGDNSDLNILARVYYDLVDFYKIAKVEELENVSVFDLESIEREETSCKNSGPKLWQLFVELLGRVKVNDKIAKTIYDVTRLDKSEYTGISSAMAEQLKNLIIETSIDNEENQANIPSNFESRVETANQYRRNLNQAAMNKLAQK